MLILIFGIFVTFIAIIFIITGITNILTLIPYVPTKDEYIKNVLKNLKLKTKNQTLYDLGCGDSRVLFIAESLGFKAIGYENSLAPFLYGYIKKSLIKSKIDIKFQSFFKANLKKADIIFVYLLPFIFTRLAPKIKKECRKGTKIISIGFQIPTLNLIKFRKRNEEKRWPSVYYYEI